MRRVIQVMVIVLIAASAWFGALATTAAQRPGPDVPAPGDGFWMFDLRGVFTDPRVAVALVHFMDERRMFERAGLGGDRRLFYMDGSVLQLLPGLTDDEAIGMLIEAGVASDDGRLLVSEISRCKLWRTAPAYGETLDDKTNLATSLGVEISLVLNQLGAAAQPCELVDGTQYLEADLFLLSFGQNVHVGGPYRPALPAFIAIPPDLEGKAPLPGPNGNLGYSGSRGRDGIVSLVVLVLAVLVLVVAARRGTKGTNRLR